MAEKNVFIFWIFLLFVVVVRWLPGHWHCFSPAVPGSKMLYTADADADAYEELEEKFSIVLLLLPLLLLLVLRSSSPDFVCQRCSVLQSGREVMHFWNKYNKTQHKT